MKHKVGTSRINEKLERIKNPQRVFPIQFRPFLQVLLDLQ